MVWVIFYFLFLNFLSCAIESIINNKRKSRAINRNKSILTIKLELSKSYSFIFDFIGCLAPQALHFKKFISLFFSIEVSGLLHS